MKIKTMPLGNMGTNCYLAWCGETKEAIVIDPGFEQGAIIKAIKTLALKVKYIVNTHGHLDHIGANREVQAFLKCPIAIGKDDAPMLTEASLNLSAQYGSPVTSPQAELLLSHGDNISFGNCSLQVLSTPGHTQGGICLYGHDLLFSGDTLFQHSIGRSDLPGGSHNQLIASINSKLMILPDQTRVLPGHGDESTIGEERIHNPWLQG